MGQLTQRQLALYLGCDCQYTYKGALPYRPAKIDLDIIKYAEYYIVKPILRPLESASFEFCNSVAKKVGCSAWMIHDLSMGYSEYISINKSAIILNELRQAGYDCDSLIEQGLAIDATKI